MKSALARKNVFHTSADGQAVAVAPLTISTSGMAPTLRSVQAVYRQKGAIRQSAPQKHWLLNGRPGQIWSVNVSMTHTSATLVSHQAGDISSVPALAPVRQYTRRSVAVRLLPGGTRARVTQYEPSAFCLLTGAPQDRDDYDCEISFIVDVRTCQFLRLHNSDASLQASVAKRVARLRDRLTQATPADGAEDYLSMPTINTEHILEEIERDARALWNYLCATWLSPDTLTPKHDANVGYMPPDGRKSLYARLALNSDKAVCSHRIAHELSRIESGKLAGAGASTGSDTPPSSPATPLTATINVTSSSWSQVTEGYLEENTLLPLAVEVRDTVKAEFTQHVRLRPGAGPSDSKMTLSGSPPMFFVSFHATRYWLDWSDAHYSTNLTHTRLQPLVANFDTSCVGRYASLSRQLPSASPDQEALIREAFDAMLGVSDLMRDCAGDAFASVISSPITDGSGGGGAAGTGAAADALSDLFISHRGFRASLEQLGLEQRLGMAGDWDMLVQSLFAQADRDQRGRIDYSDFRAFFCAPPAPSAASSGRASRPVSLLAGSPLRDGSTTPLDEDDVNTPFGSDDELSAQDSLVVYIRSSQCLERLAKLPLEGNLAKVGGDLKSWRNRLRLHWQTRFCTLDRRSRELRYYSDMQDAREAGACHSPMAESPLARKAAAMAAGGADTGGDAPRGVLLLDHATGVTATDAYRRDNAFQVSIRSGAGTGGGGGGGGADAGAGSSATGESSERTYVFACKNREQRDLWIRSLDRIIRAGQEASRGADHLGHMHTRQVEYNRLLSLSFARLGVAIACMVRRMATPPEPGLTVTGGLRVRLRSAEGLARRAGGGASPGLADLGGSPGAPGPAMHQSPVQQVPATGAHFSVDLFVDGVLAARSRPAPVDPHSDHTGVTWPDAVLDVSLHAARQLVFVLREQQPAAGTLVTPGTTAAAAAAAATGPAASMVDLASLSPSTTAMSLVGGGPASRPTSVYYAPAPAAHSIPQVDAAINPSTDLQLASSSVLLGGGDHRGMGLLLVGCLPDPGQSSFGGPVEHPVVLALLGGGVLCLDIGVTVTPAEHHVPGRGVQLVGDTLPGFSFRPAPSPFASALAPPPSPLTESVFGHPLDARTTAVMRWLIAAVEKSAGLTEEGIYRLSGSLTQVQAFRDMIAHSSDSSGISLPGDVHVVAATLKLLLRELPVPLLADATHAAPFEAAVGT
ncbi:hypothetical protein, variant 1 [Fonticula alba]|uniref:Uncharacterized protein n=1 Tax=Fonticula alba TaxID=691883 RepID=A0A058Z875_FONAL|nr:hypothetical protein, variant 1 [Fonticula alba]KCV70326.1 hypothetical protein, variant 1 [Fonticula alba]|eukprot:XP_009494842.1 hypothetical protein, variant 1 [Fonticula alba]